MDGFLSMTGAENETIKCYRFDQDESWSESTLDSGKNGGGK